MTEAPEAAANRRGEDQDPSTHARRRLARTGNLPLVWHVRMSHGWQRGMLLIGLVLLIVFILVAVAAPLLAPYGYSQISSGSGTFPRLHEPGGRFVWGTTVGGYDVYSRVIWGARTALLTVILAIVPSVFLGVSLGLISGYLGGRLDRALVMLSDTIYSFPSLLLAIVVSIVVSGGQSSYFGGMVSAALAIMVVFVPQYFRVIRAETLRIKTEPFIDAARVMGSPRPSIMIKHILRNSTRTIPLILTLNASEAILTLAGLGFLGFGIAPTAAAEWGYDLNRAILDTSSGIWWTGLFPGMAIVLLVLGITLLGESINDVADPKLRAHKWRRSLKKVDS